ncbi:uncharacterized protein ISCGN_002283 [Ixodes scapularis]
MASGFVCVALGLLFTALAADLLMSDEELEIEEIVVSDMYTQKHVVIIDAVLAIAALGSFLSSGLRDTPVYNTRSKKFQRAADEDSRSLFEIALGVAIFKHLKNIFLRSKTVYEDLPALSTRIQCSLMLDRLYSLITETK